jgi:hypothetical protein
MGTRVDQIRVVMDNLSTHTAGPLHTSGARIKWKFTTERARQKLTHAYPDIAKESKSL